MHKPLMIVWPSATTTMLCFGVLSLASDSLEVGMGMVAERWRL